MIAEKVTVDTVELLKECDAGVKTAVKSLDEVLDVVENKELKELLEKNKAEHEKTGLLIDSLLAKCNKEGKDPSPMAQVMAWTKINMKIMADKNDKTIADLITDGCGMGIKSLCKYKNEYEHADKEAVDIAEKLIKLEDDLVYKLRRYL